MYDNLKPKFMVLGNNIYIAKVNFHKEIVKHANQMGITYDAQWGGGWWKLDREKKTITLENTSQDYGDAHISKIVEAVKRGNVGELHDPQRFKDYKVLVVRDDVLIEIEKI